MNTRIKVKEVVRPMARGQITLPISIRKSMNITVDSLLLIEQIEGGILIKPIQPTHMPSNIEPATRSLSDILEEIKDKPFSWDEEDDKRLEEGRQRDIERLKELYN